MINENTQWLEASLEDAGKRIKAYCTRISSSHKERASKDAISIKMNEFFNMSFAKNKYFPKESVEYMPYAFSLFHFFIYHCVTLKKSEDRKELCKVLFEKLGAESILEVLNSEIQGEKYLIFLLAETNNKYAIEPKIYQEYSENIVSLLLEKLKELKLTINYELPENINNNNNNNQEALNKIKTSPAAPALPGFHFPNLVDLITKLYDDSKAFLNLNKEIFCNTVCLMIELYVSRKFNKEFRFTQEEKQELFNCYLAAPTMIPIKSPPNEIVENFWRKFLVGTSKIYELLDFESLNEYVVIMSHIKAKALKKDVTKKRFLVRLALSNPGCIAISLLNKEKTKELRYSVVIESDGTLKTNTANSSSITINAKNLTDLITKLKKEDDRIAGYEHLKNTDAANQEQPETLAEARAKFGKKLVLALHSLKDQISNAKTWDIIEQEYLSFLGFPGFTSLKEWQDKFEKNYQESNLPKFTTLQEVVNHIYNIILLPSLEPLNLLEESVRQAIKNACSIENTEIFTITTNTPPLFMNLYPLVQNWTKTFINNLKNNKLNETDYPRQKIIAILKRLINNPLLNSPLNEEIKESSLQHFPDIFNSNNLVKTKPEELKIELQSSIGVRSLHMLQKMSLKGWPYITEGNKYYLQIDSEKYEIITGKVKNFTNIKAVSIGSGLERELIILDSNSTFLKEKYEDLKKLIKNSADKPEVIFKIVIEFIRTKCLTQTENVDTWINAWKTPVYKNSKNQEFPLIRLDNFIINKRGVCRHHALLLAYLLEHLIKDQFLPAGEIRVKRGNILQAGAHVWVEYIVKNPSFNIPKMYLVDSLWNKYGDIRKMPKEGYGNALGKSIQKYSFFGNQNNNNNAAAVPVQQLPKLQ